MNIERPKSEQPLPEHAKRVYKGVVFDVYQWEQEMYDGTKKTFEKLKRPDRVVVFPVLPDGKILLTEQEQPGKDPFVGGVGGRVDEGEEILEAAKREMREESGYEAEKFILWDARQPTSKIEWAVYTFIAKGCKKVADLHLDAGEKITLKPVTFDEFVELGAKEDFAEKEVGHQLLEAKYNLEKREKLKKLFNPNS